MKQFQISYENKDKLYGKLAGIRRECEKAATGSPVFYITWTKSAQAEIDTVTNAIETYFPAAAYYGNEASGNISMGRFTYGINITCYAFEAPSTATELVWVGKDTELSSLEDLWRYCGTKKDLRGIELIPAISCLEELGIDRNVPAVDPDILIFGGASVNYDDATFGADIIAKGNPMSREGMAVMLYSGKELSFSATDVLGWKGLGKLMEVTRSTGKTIREIDGMPAYSVYEKYLNLTTEDKDTLVFPLIAEEEGYEFIRTPQIIQPDKSMLMFAQIPEGTRVRICYGDKNTILSDLYDKAAQIAAYRPDAVKAYSCAARRLFWGDYEVGRETEIVQNIAPVCGFYTGGEILRFGEKLRVLNQTLAIVSLREGEGGAFDPGSVQKHEADKSLLSRLTFFAEKIVEEEKAQRQLAEGFESVFKSQYQVMYYVDLRNERVLFLHGDEDAKKFLSIFNTGSPQAMFENFSRYYVEGAIVPEDRARVRAIMNIENIHRVLRTQNSMSVNYRVRRNLIDPVYTEMRVIKAAEENGELQAVILAFKLTDEELRTALETQKKMEEDARIIGALSEDFGCVDYIELLDNEQNDISFGVRSSELLRRLIPGWDKEKSFSKKLDMLTNELVYGPEKEAFYSAMRREVILEKLRTADSYFINTRMYIDKQIRYYQVQVSAIRDKGVLAGIVVGTRSIDEMIRKEAEAQKRLEEALERAEIANESKSTFLFNMSHDIRTPMNAIKGFTDMARKYISDREKVRDYLDKIDISGQQLLTLINQVLEMSRIESGKIEFDEQPVNIRDRFEAMTTVISAQAQSKGLEFRYALEDITHYNVLADDSRMGQITLNVAGNAIKYTPAGGRIDFRLREIPARKEGFASYIFTVADTGIGMSEEYLKKLFEPFSREKSSTVSRIQGTGLGMSIVHNLVELKGGEIKVDSAPGKGTRFDITLDFRIAEDMPGTEAGEPDETDADISFRGKTVLLVDDNEMNREIAEDLLSEAGLKVETASDGSDAVAIMKIKGPAYYDFILMDIQMPIMNGYEATKAIRSMYPDAGLPIIALSANAFAEDRLASLEAGMNDHVAKPINTRELLASLAKFM